MIDHIGDLLETGGLSRKRVKDLKKALEWAQELNEKWEDIQNIIEQVENGKGLPKGVHGGKEFEDRWGKLGRKNRGGYIGFDIRPPGRTGRGRWRLVRDTRTGKWWFTDDHYETFYEIR
jgi:guanyl-specific ribonuclease Sa